MSRRNHVNRKLSESDGAPAKPTGEVSGEFDSEMFEYDGGRQVTVYVPSDPAEAIVFAGDGQEIYGAVLCASLGGGYKPPGIMPSPLPRTYLVAGTQEPFFLENARRWAQALRDAEADVVLNERTGSEQGVEF